MTDGAFAERDRPHLTAMLGGCAGCHRPAAELHHRRPRQRGGTSNPAIGRPYNALPLCSRHHAWAENNRDHVKLLGWLTPTASPDHPFWTATYGWCTWTLLDGDGPPCWCIQPFQPPEGPDRDNAARAFQHQETTT